MKKYPLYLWALNDLFWCLEKTPIFIFNGKQVTTWFASRQVEISYYRCISWQRGRGFGTLVQVIGRTAIPLLRKYIVPAAKRVVADLMDFAAPENAEAVRGRKSFKNAAKSVGMLTLKKHLGSGSRKTSASRVIPTKAAKPASWSRRDILKKILVNHVKQFSVSNF